ncbi:MAG: HipA N-terminal domain-containing protein [Chitinophaga sp.]|uniref:HipA N-terminal domain-containing protein n=1 Tax=Chitinophaga sp. TaxID=1869181 RepID=UPI001AFDA074|nr:HipA N-terminal domain-containing protein [Chitinophaga sp.]MBO9731664.1 HipA N-terminal domain-containing protein [Chitinophaga sp.]
MTKKGKVFYRDKLAGIISETNDGYIFRYDEAYLGDNNARPVSLTLPLNKGAYFSRVLFPFFDGLIPEGWLLDIATAHWKIKSYDRFELLLRTCGDTIGAVYIVPDDNN